MDKPSSVQCQANGDDLTAQQQRWLDHFQQCQYSGMSMAAYVRSQGIPEKTFYYWRSRFDVVTLNRTHSLKYLKEGVCINESRKTENLYG
jgi:hypothetical protein